MIEVALTHEKKTVNLPEHWRVTYTICDLSFPRDEVFSTEELAQDFIATLERGDK